METDGPFCFPEAGPGKERQTQVDRRGIQGVNRVFEFHGQRFLVVKLPGDADQMMGKIGTDAPVPHLVGFRQGAAGNLAADAHVVEFVALCPEYASWANAMMWNWSMQVKLFTLKLPRYLSTQRRKVFSGMKSMIWVNTNGPGYRNDPSLK